MHIAIYVIIMFLSLSNYKSQSAVKNTSGTATRSNSKSMHSAFPEHIGYHLGNLESTWDHTDQLKMIPEDYFLKNKTYIYPSLFLVHG